MLMYLFVCLQALGSCFRGLEVEEWPKPSLDRLPSATWASVRAGVDKIPWPAWGDVKVSRGFLAHMGVSWPTWGGSWPTWREVKVSEGVLCFFFTLLRNSGILCQAFSPALVKKNLRYSKFEELLCTLRR